MSFKILWLLCFKPLNNFFSISLSYVVRPGTRFDPTCSQFGHTEKRKENTVVC